MPLQFYFQDEEIENSEPALEKSDLRHQLAERRRRLEDLRTSGLKVQVTNENYQTAPVAAAEEKEEEEEEERERSPVSPPPVTEVEVEEMDDDDEAYLEDMRRRALESMNRLVRLKIPIKLSFLCRLPKKHAYYWSLTYTETPI